MEISWILFRRSWAASHSSAAWDSPSMTSLTSPAWWSASVPWTSWRWRGTGWRLWICAACYEWLTLRVLIYGEPLETSLHIYLSLSLSLSLSLCVMLSALPASIFFCSSSLSLLSVCYYSQLGLNVGSIYSSNVIRSAISKSPRWQQHSSVTRSQTTALKSGAFAHYSDQKCPFLTGKDHLSDIENIANCGWMPYMSYMGSEIDHTTIIDWWKKLFK